MLQVPFRDAVKAVVVQTLVAMSVVVAVARAAIDPGQKICCLSCATTMNPGTWNLIFVILFYAAVFVNSLGLAQTLVYGILQPILSGIGLMCASYLIHPPNLAAWEANNGKISRYFIVYMLLLLSTIAFFVLAIVWGCTWFGTPSRFYRHWEPWFSIMTMFLIPTYIFTPPVVALVIALPWMRTRSCQCCSSGLDYQTLTNGGLRTVPSYSGTM